MSQANPDERETGKARSGPPAPDVTVVATVYRDASSVEPLSQELFRALTAAGLTFEVILVDDASPDDSWSQICRVASSTPEVRGIRLRRNRGQHAAAAAGVREAKGGVVVLMDGDREDPAEEIPSMIKHLRESRCDVVYAVEEGGRNRPSSRLFWFVIIRLLDVKIVPDQLMLRVMTREIADAMGTYRESIRTTAGIMADITSNHSVWPVKRHIRLRSGGSNYGRYRRLKLAVDLMIGLTEAPLNFMLFLGFVICLLSMGGVAFSVLSYVFGHPWAGYTSLMLAITFFGGFTTLTLGFIGRYLANIAAEVRQRPLYAIAERTPAPSYPIQDA